MPKTVRSAVLAIVATLAGGCAVGPDYQRPAAPVSADYKEAQDWQRALPRDHLPRGDWWEVFGDTRLNGLEQQLLTANQNIAAAEARYRQARAAAQQARAGFFPTLSATASSTRNGTAADQPVTARHTLSLDASWEVDVWGRVRRAVESGEATAEAGAADLAAARLSAEAELALNYFELRSVEEQEALYRQTVQDYEKSLQLTNNQYAVGVAGRAEVVQAEAQLQAAQAQAVAVGVQRAQLEHAVAILVGVPPAQLSLARSELPAHAPLIPVDMPSDLLERRPDVAAAERRVAAANAEIGVARAAYFPTLTLSGSGGYQSNSFAHWFEAPNRFWSLGPSLALTLFDAGARRAQNEQAVAAYDETVASYRQTVLGALQEVEDNLVALRLLDQQIEFQRAAVQAAQEAVRLVTNQYKAGVVSFLNVLTAETTLLNDQRSLLQLRGQQFSASVNLIKALGGGWQGPAAPAAPVAGPPH